MKRKGEIRNIAIIVVMTISVMLLLFGVAKIAMTTLSGKYEAKETTVEEQENPYLDAFMTAQTMECYRLLNEYLYYSGLISTKEHKAVLEQYLNILEEITQKGEISKGQWKQYDKKVKELIKAERKANKIIVGDEESLKINSGTVDTVGFADGIIWGHIDLEVIALREKGQISEESYAEYEDKRSEVYIDILNGGNHQTITNFFDYAYEILEQDGVDIINMNGM